MKKKVTFADIAKRTGYSKTTISRYFNNPDSLSISTQDIIAKALEELDYHENKLARVLATGKTEIIGVLIPNLKMHYYAELLSSLLKTTEKHNYKFLIFPEKDSITSEQEILDELMAYNVEGLLVISRTIPSQILAQLPIPIVTIEREDQYVNSVNTDNYQGGLLATQELIDCGSEVLIHINDTVQPIDPGYGRIRGFLKVCQTHNMPHHEYYRKGKWEHSQLIEKMNDIIQEVEEKYPDKKIGIFVSNDTYANILLNTLVQKYRTFPEHWKLVGFDDSPISSEAIIPFTTIRQNIDEISKQAIQLLMDLVEERKTGKKDKDESYHHIMIPVSLIQRDTTK